VTFAWIKDQYEARKAGRHYRSLTRTILVRTRRHASTARPDGRRGRPRPDRQCPALRATEAPDPHRPTSLFDRYIGLGGRFEDQGVRTLAGILGRAGRNADQHPLLRDGRGRRGRGNPPVSEPARTPRSCSRTTIPRSAGGRPAPPGGPLHLPGFPAQATARQGREDGHRDQSIGVFRDGRRAVYFFHSSPAWPTPFLRLEDAEPPRRFARLAFVRIRHRPRPSRSSPWHHPDPSPPDDGPGQRQFYALPT
jgi:hypothetical protein